MTLAKDFASKAAVAFVALAMALSMFAPAAQAQSAEDMQKMINDLLAQIAALQSQTGGASAVAGVCPYTWTRDLNVGSTGADVMKLQQFLNANADTRVSASGAGSVGAETEYYGPATAAAVSKMQVMYRAEILSPAGLVNPTGYFGPSTRAKANAVCSATTPTNPTNPTTPVDEDEDDNGSVGLSGEADLTTFEVEGPSDDTVEEGSSDAEIGMVTVEFSDGDASISRLDVALTKSGTNRPWKAFDTVSLWVDGDMVAEVEAGDKSDYLGSESNGVLRFSGLDIVAMEDEELEITVAASIKDNLDNADQTTWTLTGKSVRFFDADGVASTENYSEADTFTIVAAGEDDEVIVKKSSNDPKATTLKLNDNSKSDWYNAFTFDLDTDDSTNDIELTTVKLQVELSTSTYNTIVDKAELVIDGITIKDVTVTDGTTTAATLSFDVDGDVVIDAGDRVEAKLMLRFNSLATSSEGITVRGKITGNDTNIVAEGSDDLAGNAISGSATGGYHTLRTTGIDVSTKSESAVVTTADGALNDYVTYKITVDVTAFDQDVFIPIASASTSWSLVTSAGVAISPAPQTASTSVVITSSAEVGGAGDAFFEINEGETETVTITVTFTPSIVNTAAGLQLNSILFDETGTVTGADDKTWTATPANDYRTDVVTIVN